MDRCAEPLWDRSPAFDGSVGPSRTHPCGLASAGARDTAAIEEPLKATLRLLGKLTREHAVDADDMRAVLAAGVSSDQIEDALAVCLAFNTIDRLADSFGFSIAGPKVFEAGAKYLHARGYR
jgi:alkylhydroperoxidase family enzyme